MLVLDKDPVWVRPKRPMTLSWSEKRRWAPWSKWKKCQKVLTTNTMYQAYLSVNGFETGYAISGAEHFWLPKDLFDENISPH